MDGGAKTFLLAREARPLPGEGSNLSKSRRPLACVYYPPVYVVVDHGPWYVVVDGPCTSRWLIQIVACTLTLFNTLLALALYPLPGTWLGRGSTRMYPHPSLK